MTKHFGAKLGSVNSIVLCYFPANIEQRRHVGRWAHLHPRRNPGKRHRRLVTQPPTDGLFPLIPFAAHRQRPLLPFPLLLFLRYDPVAFASADSLTLLGRDRLGSSPTPVPVNRLYSTLNFRAMQARLTCGEGKLLILLTDPFATCRFLNPLANPEGRHPCSKDFSQNALENLQRHGDFPG